LPEPKETKQLLPEPKTGSRPTICMCASFQDKMNVPVRVPLDTGYDTPMMSKEWADSHCIPLVTCIESKIVENFNGATVEAAG
jgi:hypothetical protein